MKYQILFLNKSTEKNNEAVFFFTLVKGRRKNTTPVEVRELF